MPRRLAFFSPFHSLRIKKYKRQEPPKPPTGFPFLKLPYFPLKYVINQMDFKDVIHLTMKYKRFKRAVESAKFRVDQFHFHLGGWHKYIVVTHQEQKLVTHQGKFEIETEYTENGYESTGLKLNGVVTPICCWRLTNMKVYAESEEAKMDVLDKITQHLLSILFVRKYTIRFLVKYDFENLFIWKYTKKFRNLNIKPVDESPIVLTPRELHFILEDIKIDVLELDLKVENDYKYPNYPLQGSEVYIQNSNWIDTDKLTIGPDCVFFTIMSYSIPNACGNRLLKEWIAGKNEKLEELRFPANDFFEKHNNQDLLEGITSTVNTFSEKKLGKLGVQYINMRVPLIDIKRSTDGRLGIISRWKWWLTPKVWHQQHIDELEEDSK